MGNKIDVVDLLRKFEIDSEHPERACHLVELLTSLILMDKVSYMQLISGSFDAEVILCFEDYLRTLRSEVFLVSNEIDKNGMLKEKK